MPGQQGKQSSFFFVFLTKDFIKRENVREKAPEGERSEGEADMGLNSGTLGS